jgi:hypothetical protein
MTMDDILVSSNSSKNQKTIRGLSRITQAVTLKTTDEQILEGYRMDSLSSSQLFYGLGQGDRPVG